jgi:hypothetical protein
MGTHDSLPGQNATEACYCIVEVCLLILIQVLVAIIAGYVLVVRFLGMSSSLFIMEVGIALPVILMHVAIHDGAHQVSPHLRCVREHLLSRVRLRGVNG